MVLTSLVGVAALAVVIGPFVASERIVYYWDFSGYWIKTIQLGDLLGEPSAALGALVESVRHQQYNLLAAVPLAPIARLFDYDRTAWVLTVLVVYGLPALAAMTFAALRLSGDRPEVRGATALAVATIVLLPALWAPLVRGSVGIGGVPLAVLVWLGVGAPLRTVPLRKACLWGVLLASMILFRRWYGFWVAAWVSAIAVEALIEGGSWRERAAGLRVVTTIALAVGGVLLLVATPIAVKMLTTDPAAIGAPYRAVDFYADGLERVIGRFGILPLLLAAGGAAAGWRDPRMRRLTRILLVQTGVILLLFLRAQRFDRHHYYLIAPQVAVFAAVAMVELVRRARAALAARVALVASAAALALGFAAAFSAPVGDALRDPWSLLATPRYRPLVRDDLPEIVRLARALDALIGESNQTIYVLSSYWLLNEDVLRNAHLSTDAPDISDHVLLSAHIDRKEPFPTRLLQADYAVVVDPPRVHLKAEEQEVITVPAEQILAGDGIGRSFRRSPAGFTLQDGTKVALYERTDAVPAHAKRALRQRLARDR